MASLLRNVGTNVLGFLAGKAAAALTGILLLRALQPEASGIYGAALGFAALFQSFAELGLNACLTRLVSSEPRKAGLWFSLGLMAQVAQTATAALLLALFLWLGGAHGASPGLVALAFGVSASLSLSSPVAATLQGLEQFALQGALSTTCSLLNAAALGILLFAGKAAPETALAAALVSACLGLFVWGFGAWWAGLRLKATRLADVVKLWKKSLPFALVSISNQFYVRVDQAILAWMVVGGAPLGFYIAAVKLVDLLVPMLGALNGPLYARLSGLHKRASKGEKGAREQAWGNLNRALRFMSLLCLPMGIGGSLLARPLIEWIFGPSFGGAGIALAWLVWVPALIGIHGCLLHGLNAVGRTLRLAQLFGFNLALNVALNLILIPRYGIAASAAASALCEGVNLLAAWFLARRSGLAPSLKAAFWPALPAALGMGVVLMMLGVTRFHPSLMMVIGAMSYAALLSMFGFIGPDEKAQWNRIWSRV